LKSDFLGKLWVRLLAITVTPVLITVVSVAVLANYVTIGQFEHFIEQDTQQRDTRLEVILERSYQEQGNWQGVGVLVPRLAALVGERVVLTDVTGRVVGDSSGQLVGQQQGRNWQRAIPLQSGGASIGTVFINPTLPGRASSLKVQAFLSGVNRSLIIGSIVAVVAGLLLAIVFSNRLRRQLAVLIRVTRQIGRGELSLRVPMAEQGDLGELGGAVNHMAQDLEEGLRARQQMVADVAHELRTPLMNINGYIEAVRDGVLPADQRTLDILSSETATLRHLVDDLQDLSLADSGRLTMDLQPLRPHEQLSAIVDSMRPRAEELGLSLSCSVSEDVPDFMADERRLRQVLANLVQNALKHTPRGGRVWFSAELRSADVELTVSDTGSGISEADQARIFERFYRVDPARARATGGAGLGLTIARELVHAMYGEMGVRSSLGEGSHFWIRLPRAMASTRPATPSRSRRVAAKDRLVAQT
jgi:two-component system, OmpR family, sensor histidine kinase BaeS